MTGMADLGSFGSRFEDQLGGKAQSLAQLVAAGFPVPPAFVVTADSLRQIIAYNDRLELLETAVQKLSKDTLPQVVVDIAKALEQLCWPTALYDDLTAQVKKLPAGRFAVRSSAQAEDSSDLSFAGQYRTVLQVELHDISAAVLDCYRSLFDEHALHYHLDHQIPVDMNAMTVIVQHLVEADVSGVAFTVNPITGHDTEILIEAVRGLGEDLVSGRVRPVHYTRDWFGRDTGTIAVSPPDGETGPAAAEPELLTAPQLDELVELCVQVQQHYGFPVDVEWALADGHFSLLQARPITRIGFTGIPDQWTTANFKDGGVSSTVCSPFMWSLYEYVWEYWLPKYMLDSALIDPAELRKLGDMFYGRPYWNLSVAKRALEVAPGYRERVFDSELGVPITYEGDGTVTAINPRTLLRVARVALRQRRIVTERQKSLTSLHDELLNTYTTRLQEIAEAADATQIRTLWRQIVSKDYHRSEGVYFWQVFINQVQLALSRDAIVKVVGIEGYFDLIASLDDVSHLRPYYDVWELSRSLREDEDVAQWWQETSPDQIVKALDSDEQAHGLPQLRKILNKYAYHSTREIDVTHPNFDTDHLPVVEMVLDAIVLDDDHGPHSDRHHLKQRYADTLQRAEARLVHQIGGLRFGQRRYDNFVAKVQHTREMLWWREEFRDISTRHYHLIRLISLRLGETLTEAGVLERAEDVWFARALDLLAYLDGKVTADHLRHEIVRHRRYYQSFRNFEPQNEIGQVFDPALRDELLFGSAKVPADGNVVTGLVGSPGTVTGTARVIAGLDDIGRLHVGDILVTRFTDTGWTSKFAMISAVVTEYGGVLCHASTVSREYGIPCVVAAAGCTTQIPDGATIRVDGSSGQVTVIVENHEERS